MDSIALSAYGLSASILLLKSIAAALVQGHGRLSQRAFQYPEDAAYWGGAQVEHESDRVVRGQRLLRNDSETQPYFLALAAAYVALEAWPLGAVLYFGLYTASRVAHAIWLLKPRQPARNRAYSLGLLVLLVIAGHVVVGSVASLLGSAS